MGISISRCVLIIYICRCVCVLKIGSNIIYNSEPWMLKPALFGTPFKVCLRWVFLSSLFIPTTTTPTSTAACDYQH